MSNYNGNPNGTSGSGWSGGGYTPPNPVSQPIFNTSTVNLSSTIANASHSFTVTKALAKGMQSAVDNGNEEAQALARRSLREKRDLLSLLITPGQYSVAYEDARQFGQSILNYSKNNGGMLQSHSQMEQTLLSDLNSVATRPLSQSDLHAFSAQMFADTAKNGKLTLPMEQTRTSADAIIGNSGSSVVSRIGEYNVQSEHIDRLETALKNPARNQNTLEAVVEIRGSNYASLDTRLNISRRMGSHFQGKQSDFDAIFATVDPTTGHSKVFTDKELGEIQSAMNANGVVSDALSSSSPMLANAQARARQKVATAAFDDTQTKGFNTIRMGHRVAKGGVKLSNRVYYWHNERSLNKAVDNLNRQIKERAGRGEDVTQLKDALQKTKERQALAKDMRKTNKEISRATRGLSKTEKRKYLTKLKMEDRMRQGKNAGRLTKKYAKLTKKSAKQLKKQAGKKATSKLLAKFAAKRAAFNAALKSLLHAVLPYVAIVLGVIILILMIFSLILIVIIVIASFFTGGIEKDKDGKDVVPFAAVQTELNKYEVDKISGEKGLEKTVLKEEKVLDSIYSDIDKSFTRVAEFDYEVMDEYGNPTDICNCMQSLSLYRLYYTNTDPEEGEKEADRKDDDEESEDEFDPALKLEKTYKKRMKTAFDKTHFLKSYSDESKKKTLKAFLDGPDSDYYKISGALANEPAGNVAGTADGSDKYSGENYQMYHKPGFVCTNYRYDIHPQTIAKSTDNYSYEASTGCDNYTRSDRNVYKDVEKEVPRDYEAEFGISITETAVYKLTEKDTKSKKGYKTLLADIESVVKIVEDAEPEYKYITVANSTKKKKVQKFSALETFVRNKDSAKRGDVGINPYKKTDTGYVFDKEELSEKEISQLKKYEKYIFSNKVYDEAQLEAAYSRYLIYRWLEERKTTKIILESVLDYVEYTYTCKGHCCGHVKVECQMEVLSDVVNIAAKDEDGKARLKAADGTAILYSNFTPDDMDILESMIGTYTDGYSVGVENWAEFKVKFSGAEFILSSVNKDAVFEALKAAGKTLDGKQTAVLDTALNGCGRFTYDMKKHDSGSAKRGSTGGATDCSGFASWIINNTPTYFPDGIGKDGTSVYTTMQFIKNMSGVKERKVPIASLNEVTFLVKNDNTYDPDTKKWSGDGSANHILLYVGCIDGKYMVIDNTSSKGGSSYRESSEKELNQYKYMFSMKQ